MREIALTATVLASALVLTACTIDAPRESPIAGPTSATPAASLSPTPRSASPSSVDSSDPDGSVVTVEPTAPAALNGPPSETNAAAVAVYFISLFPYAFATGDTTSWESLSGASCSECADITNTVHEATQRGEHDTGGWLEVTHSNALQAKANLFAAWVELVQHPSTTVDSSGTVLDEVSETKALRADLTVRWTGDHWQVDAVGTSRMDQQ